MNAQVFLVVAVAMIFLFKNAETPGAFLRHQVGGQGLQGGGREVVSLDIVSKFKPTILCDIRSWDYTTFPGHFDMVWASPVCTEYSRDAPAAHFDPLMWVIENPATGLLKTRPFMERALGGRDLLQVRNSVQEADAAVDQRALEAKAKPVQARQPLRGVAGRQAPPGRAAGAAADGGAVREGQPITRAALQRSCCAVRGDCASIPD